MATGGVGTATSSQPIVQPLHRGPPVPAPLNTVSPPSRRELASWWKKFRKTTEKTDEKSERTTSYIPERPWPKPKAVLEQLSAGLSLTPTQLIQALVYLESL